MHPAREAAGDSERHVGARVWSMDQGLLSPDPEQGGTDANDAHDADGRLVVAGRDGTPLVEAGPEPLDNGAVVVDPGRTGGRSLVALGRDR